MGDASYKTGLIFKEHDLQDNGRTHIETNQHRKNNIPADFAMQGHKQQSFSVTYTKPKKLKTFDLT